MTLREYPFIDRLKEITVPESLDALAETHTGRSVDIYEQLAPDLVNKITDTLYEFINALKQVSK